MTPSTSLPASTPPPTLSELSNSLQQAEKLPTEEKLNEATEDGLIWLMERWERGVEGCRKWMDERRGVDMDVDVDTMDREKERERRMTERNWGECWFCGRDGPDDFTPHHSYFGSKSNTKGKGKGKEKEIVIGDSDPDSDDSNPIVLLLSPDGSSDNDGDGNVNTSQQVDPLVTKLVHDTSILLLRLVKFKKKGDVARWSEAFERLIAVGGNGAKGGQGVVGQAGGAGNEVKAGLGDGDDRMGCLDCIREYQRAKKELGERFLTPRYPPAQVSQFYIGLKNKDRLRIISALPPANNDHSPILNIPESKSTNSGKRKRNTIDLDPDEDLDLDDDHDVQLILEPPETIEEERSNLILTPATLYHVLWDPQHWNDDEIRGRVIKLMRYLDLRSSSTIASYTSLWDRIPSTPIPPSLILMCFHTQEEVRNWARDGLERLRQRRKAKSSDRDRKGKGKEKSKDGDSTTSTTWIKQDEYQHYLKPSILSIFHHLSKRSGYLGLSSKTAKSHNPSSSSSSEGINLNTVLGNPLDPPMRDYFLTTDPEAFWKSLALVIGLLEGEENGNVIMKDCCFDGDYKATVNGTGGGGGGGGSGLVSLVISHLSDRGEEHFRWVLECWGRLLSGLGEEIWKRVQGGGGGGGAGFGTGVKSAGIGGKSGSGSYAEVVLNSILDNPAFEKLFLTIGDSTSSSSLTSQPPPVTPQTIFNIWLFPFLDSVPSNQLGGCLTHLSSTLFEKFQRDRFSILCKGLAVWKGAEMWWEVLEKRVAVMKGGNESGKNVIDGNNKKPSRVDFRSLSKIFELHGDLLVKFAFGKEGSKPNLNNNNNNIPLPGPFGENSGLIQRTERVWSEAKTTSRIVVGHILKTDSLNVKRFVFDLVKAAKNPYWSSNDKKGGGSSSSSSTTFVPLPTPVEVSTTIWAQVYNVLSARNSPPAESFNAGIFYLLTAISESAQIENLRPRVWIKDQTDSGHGADSVKRLRGSIKCANVALETMRGSLSGAIEKYMERNDNRWAQDFKNVVLAQDESAKAFVALLFSPLDEIHNLSLGIIREIYDVHQRSDCFRELLRQFPRQMMSGITHALHLFIEASSTLYEMTGMAKRIVRCLDDVNEVLCDNASGLFRDPVFMLESGLGGLDGSGRVHETWKLMCEVSALIFSHTPTWAPYYENEAMTEWMRDAISFSETMVDNVRTWEAAATGSVGVGDSTMTGIDSSQKKMTNAGAQLISSLNAPLDCLLAWLRLNDEDMLNSTTKLICKMIDRFAKSRIRLKPKPIEKLRKFIEKANRALDEDRSGKAGMIRSTILKEDQVLSLVLALSKHPEQGKDFEDLMPNQEEEEKEILEGVGAEIITFSTDDDDIVEVSNEEHKKWWNQMQKSKKPPAAAAVKTQDKKGKASVRAIEIDEDEDEDEDEEGFLKELAIKKQPEKSKQPSKSSAPTIAKNAAAAVAGFAKKPTPKAPQSDAMAEVKRKAAAQKAQMNRRAAPVPFGRSNVGASTSSKRPPIPVSVKTKFPPAPAPARSDSSEEEDSDGEPGGLASLAKAQRSPMKKPPQPARRTIKMLDSVAEQHHKQMLARQAAQKSNNRFNRQQVVSDFTGLHRTILQWDPAHNDQYPPDQKGTPRSLPTSFKSPEEYIAAFRPLLLIETWSQIQRAQEEARIEPRVVRAQIAGRATIDDFCEIYVTIEHANMQEKMFFSETDLIELRQGSARIFAKVHGVKRKPAFWELALKCHFGSDYKGIGQGVVSKTSWEICKLYNLSTVHREWSALASLPYLDLVDDILNCQLAKAPPEPEEGRLNRMKEAHQVNDPQAKAIVNTLKSRGFSLIQGPPGTGKTKTILGLIGVFMADRPRPAQPIRPGQAAARPDPAQKPKILLCAPSNAAVDEVAKRAKEGVRDHSGRLVIPKVVRIGADTAVNVSVKDIFLDELVEQKVNPAGSGGSSGDGTQMAISSIRGEIDKLREQRDSKQKERDSIRDNEALRSQFDTELRSIKAKLNSFSQQLDSQKDKQTQNNRSMDIARRKARLEVLADADVICATLSGSGHDYMAQLPFDFETVVIDEAAQSVELSSLIPLRYGCTRCIMVGDPNQLPPTVISQSGTDSGYNKSLFVRLHEKQPENAYLLSIQYRMHSHISAFPSKRFYRSELKDGPGMDEKTKQPWHSNALFPPYVFLHVASGREETNRSHSFYNRDEAAIAVSIYERLKSDFPSIDFNYRIGIVTPYKGQVVELKRQFRTRFGQDIIGRIDFNTVDGFQGQEKDIIILTCVRGGAAENALGFLKDTRRMNVALTRARSSLFVIGNSNSLRRNQHWSALIEDADNRKLVKDCDTMTFRQRSSAPPAISTGTPTNRRPSGETRQKGKGKGKEAPPPAPTDLLTPAAMRQQTQSRGGKINSARKQDEMDEDREPGEITKSPPRRKRHPSPSSNTDGLPPQKKVRTDGPSTNRPVLKDGSGVDSASGQRPGPHASTPEPTTRDPRLKPPGHPNRPRPIAVPGMDEPQPVVASSRRDQEPPQHVIPAIGGLPRGVAPPPLAAPPRPANMTSTGAQPQYPARNHAAGLGEPSERVEREQAPRAPLPPPAKSKQSSMFISRKR